MRQTTPKGLRGEQARAVECHNASPMPPLRIAAPVRVVSPCNYTLQEKEDIKSAWEFQLVLGWHWPCGERVFCDQQESTFC